MARILLWLSLLTLFAFIAGVRGTVPPSAHAAAPAHGAVHGVLPAHGVVPAARREADSAYMAIHAQPNPAEVQEAVETAPPAVVPVADATESRVRSAKFVRRRRAHP
ncbi:hypothetical protein BD626DRAFT_168915 [Schizophyllum amplum]|uniref:Uncharacterized protein n=1 Tax=Schizophyllum amplum TaxID=97359 RepID=A0A550CQN2_9AGAR|nr:hypothetical protein BD626DRAFT_168915 [Auriculariopsis ampla]